MENKCISFFSMKPTCLKYAGKLMLIYYLCSTNANAQTNNDAGLWSSFSIEHAMNGKFSFSASEELRLKDNFTSIDMFYTNVGVSYKLSKNIKFTGGYRSAQKFNYNEPISFRHRFYFDVLLKAKLNSWAFSFRNRFQDDLKDVFSSEYGKIPELQLRHKAEAKYKLNNGVEPYISAELRFQLRNVDFPEANGYFNRLRWILGFDYNLNKQKSFGLYYLIQREFNVSERDNLYIIGFQYTIEIG